MPRHTHELRSRTRRVVMITGASAGIGRAAAIAFARRGAAVGVLARGRAGLEGAVQDVELAGGRALPLQVDVSDADAVDAAAARLEIAYGPIDVWVNNAMTSVVSPVREMTASDYRRVTDVTYLGVVHGTLAALRRMAPRNRGWIIQVGSALASRGIPLQSAYCASKHAVQGFCDSLRAELRHDGSAVRLTMVHLPAIDTPQFDWVKSRLDRRARPVPPIFTPEVAAEAIEWASRHARREIHVGSPTAASIVARKAAAGLLDRFLARRGVAAQQTGEAETLNRPDNLWRAVDDIRDFGVRGRFETRARRRSWQLWLTEHRGALAAASAALALTAAAGVRARR